MSQIKAKQIKLVDQGDLIVGNGSNNGSILSAGDVGQVLHVGGSALAWDWLQTLYDPNGVIVADTALSTNGVNYFSLTAGGTGTGPTIAALGPDTNIDVNIAPVGLGEVLAPVGYTANIVSPNALITKQYVDSAVTGLDWKNSARIATTGSGDLSGYTYNAGNEPTGNVWSGVTSAPTIDGVTLNDGDRLLIKDATDQRGNGLFTYDATAQAFIRSNDADNTPNNEVSDGMATFIEEGTVNAGTAWVLTDPNGEADLGTDNLSFTQFAGTNLYTAGTGLSLTGTQFDANTSTTIGVDGSNNLVVASNTTQGNVLISTGTAGQEATWGALNLSNQNSVTGVLDVTNGGTGLSNVPEGHILVGTDGSSLSTVAPTPTTDSNTVYVLQTTASGVQYAGITLNQLSNVDVSAAMDEDVMVFNASASQWEPQSLAALTEDRFVAVSVGDTAPGTLTTKIVLQGALSANVLNAGGDEDYQLSIKVDETTIRVNASDELAVGEGTLNQQLVSQGAGTDAVWQFVDTLYNEDGDEVLNVEGSGNPVTITSTTGGTTITNQDGDINITPVSGNVVLDGTTFPSSVPAPSVLVAEQDNVLTPEIAVTAVSGGGDQILQYNASANSFEWVSRTVVGGNDFGNILLVGNQTGDAVVSANQANDSLTLDAGIGLNVSAANSTNSVELRFGNFGMASEVVELTDTITFFDGSNADTPSLTTLASAFDELGVPYGITTSAGILIQTNTSSYSAVEIVADTATDALGIVVTNGDGTGGNPTVGLDVTGLSANTEVDPDNDYFVMFDSSANKNTKVTVDDMLTDAGLGTPAWASANAAGTSNESFTGFFANVPVADDTVVVYFNGLSLKQGGWTRSGSDLTLVDSVNGYGTDSSDVITASYEY